MLRLTLTPDWPGGKASSCLDETGCWSALILVCSRLLHALSLAATSIPLPPPSSLWAGGPPPHWLSRLSSQPIETNIAAAAAAPPMETTIDKSHCLRDTPWFQFKNSNQTNLTEPMRITLIIINLLRQLVVDLRGGRVFVCVAPQLIVTITIAYSS